MTEKQGIQFYCVEQWLRSQSDCFGRGEGERKKGCVCMFVLCVCVCVGWGLVIGWMVAHIPKWGLVMKPSLSQSLTLVYHA